MLIFNSFSFMSIHTQNNPTTPSRTSIHPDISLIDNKQFKNNNNNPSLNSTPQHSSSSNNPKIFYTRKELYTAFCGMLLIGCTILACFYIITLSLYDPGTSDASHQVCETVFTGNSTSNSTVVTCVNHDGRMQKIRQIENIYFTQNTMHNNS